MGSKVTLHTMDRKFEVEVTLRVCEIRAHSLMHRWTTTVQVCPRTGYVARGIITSTNTTSAGNVWTSLATKAGTGGRRPRKGGVGNTLLIKIKSTLAARGESAVLPWDPSGSCRWIASKGWSDDPRKLLVKTAAMMITSNRWRR